jgi:hypothetical protein
LINGEWVARDPVVAGSAFYGLVNLTNNNYLTNAYYPPDITLSASNIMTASATLDGSDFPSESNTVYWFEYGTDPNNYAGMTQPTPLATSDNPAILSCSVVGLNPSTLYHFQLVVTNDWSVDTGPELGGDQTFTTLDPVPAVNTWAASSITATSATLNGNVSADGPAAANAYFEYGVDTNQNDLQYSTTYFPPGDIYFHAYSYNATGLTPSTTYYYQAVAFNNSHTGYGAWSNFTTVALQPPAVVTTNATYVSCGGDCAPIPVLNGTVNGNGSSFTGYFQYGLSSNGTITYSFDTSQHPFSGNNNSPQIFNFTMTNVTLNASTTYHYRIVAFNGASEGVGGDQTFLSP